MKVCKTMVLPALLLAAAACSGADNTLASSDVTDLTASAYRSTSVATVKVEPAAPTVAVGSTVKLGSNLYDSQGRRITGMGGVFARWVSSDTTVATVASTGLVHGLRNGVVTIKAIAGDVSAASTVTVGTGAPEATKPPEGSTTPTPSTPSTPSAPKEGSGSTTPTTPSTPTTPTTPSTPSAPSTPTTPTTPTTPSVPPAPPAPSAPSTSTGPGLSGVALISDDYTKYSSTAAFLAQVSSNIGGTGGVMTALYHDGRNAQLASIDPNVRYNGHPSLRYDLPGGTSSLPELWPSLPRNLSTMWLRAKIRFGPGFITTGTLTNSSNAYKLLGWGLAGSNGSGRLEITNTNQYDLYWGATTNAGVTVVPNTDPGGGPHLSTEWSDGKWYDYIIEYKITSPTTAEARSWLAVDGQAPVLQMTRTRTAAPGYTMPQVNSVMLGMNFNQIRTANQNQQLWYGQWEVVDGAQHPNPFGVTGPY